MNQCIVCGLSLAIGLGLTPPAVGQPARKVYTYVDQMPGLPHSAGGITALAAAIQQRLRYPTDARRSHLEGRVLVSFVVTETGQTDDIRVVKSLSPSCDQAALDAVRRLPRLVPGRHQGQPVAVSLLAVPVDFRLATSAPGTGSWSAAEAPIVEPPVADQPRLIFAALPDSLGRVYSYVEQMPALPGAGGVVAALQQSLVVPAGTPEGRVLVSFIVGPHGSVSEAAIAQGLSGAADAAVLAAVNKLPRFVPARHNGRPVAVSFTVPVAVRRPGHLYEAHETTVRAIFPNLTGYLRRNLRVPAVVATQKLRGQVGVDFVVQANGRVDSDRVTSSLCTACDAEALRLVRALPAWIPARDFTGQFVATRQHLELPLPLPDPTMPYPATTKVLASAQPPPMLLDGTSGAAIGQALAHAVEYPAAMRQQGTATLIDVEFVVDANGLIRNVRVVASRCPSCDQAVLAALAQLGFLLPGRQNGQAVAVQMRLVVPFIPAAAAKQTSR